MCSQLMANFILVIHRKITYSTFEVVLRALQTLESNSYGAKDILRAPSSAKRVSPCLKFSCVEYSPFHCALEESLNRKKAPNEHLISSQVPSSVVCTELMTLM